MKTNFKFIIPARLLCGFLASLNAEISTAENEGKGELSLPMVLQAIENNYLQKGLDKATNTWAEAAYSAADQGIGSWALESEATIDPKGEDKGQSLLGVFVQKNLRFGVNRDALKQQFDSEALAMKLEAEGEVSGQKLFAGRAFVHFLHYRRIAQAADKMLTTLTPLLTDIEQASTRGNTDGLSLLKWKILKQEITSSRSEAVVNFKMTSDQLAQNTGLSIPGDYQNAGFTEPSFNLSNIEGAKTSPKIKALVAQSKAFSNKALVFSDSFELNAGVGIERDFKGESTALVARFSLPLGQGGLRQSERDEAKAQSAFIHTKAEIASESVSREIKHLRYNIGSAQTHIQILQAQRNEVEKLYKTTIDGMSKGLADLAQVMESSEKLFELESELSQKICDMQTEGVELLVLTGDKI